MENEQVLKALRQVELIKKYGGRPDVWLYKPDPDNPEQKIYFTPEQPDLRLTEEEVQEIVDALDLPALIEIPDNTRDY